MSRVGFRLQPVISLVGAWRVWERNLRVYKRNWKYALLPNFFEPVFYLLGLGLGLGAYVVGGGSFQSGYAAFIAPGLVAASAMNGASFETTYNVYVKLRFARLYDAIVTTRVNMEDVACGEILWAITRALLYGGAFLLIALFFGIPLSARLLLAPLAVALVGYCFAALGLAFTSLIDNIDLYTYYFTMFLTPAFLFSGIFFPVEERFPAFLVAVAQYTPLYRAVRLLRDLVNGSGSHLWWDVLYLLVLGTLLAAFAISRLRRRVIA
ncbi:MAG: ABC transporter permease [Deinococcus sp.]|nr:ABC transporter permease [Deinococcus sp.]